MASADDVYTATAYRINATVIGSKDAKEGDAEEHAEEGAEGEAKDAAEAEEATKDTNGDAKEAMEDVKEGA